MQNLVVLHNVCARVRCPKKFEGRLGLIPFWPQEIHLQHLLHTKFGWFKSNHMGIRRGRHKKIGDAGPCPTEGVPLEFCNGNGLEKKLEWCPYQKVKKVWRHVCSFCTVLAIDRQMDRMDKTSALHNNDCIKSSTLKTAIYKTIHTQ